MNVFTSAGSCTGTFGWSGGMSACAVACGGAAACPRVGPRYGRGRCRRGRAQHQRPDAEPATTKKLRTARPGVVNCQPPLGGSAAGRPPVSELPHSIQNFAWEAAGVPHCGQKRAGMRAADNFGRLADRQTGDSAGRALVRRLAAHALEVLARDGPERRILPQEQDDAAGDRERGPSRSRSRGSR